MTNVSEKCVCGHGRAKHHEGVLFCNSHKLGPQIPGPPCGCMRFELAPVEPDMATELEKLRKRVAALERYVRQIDERTRGLMVMR